MHRDPLPLVSIVIPSYNGMPYLEEAIESVLAQDYPNIELIVLDDGSTDETFKFLTKYKEKFYFEKHPNMGQAKTLNKGWQLSKGEILGYLSADDKLEKDAVSASIKTLAKDPNVILTYCDNMLINHCSQTIRRLNTPEFSLEEMYLKGTTSVAVASFFRRSAFQVIGGWNPRYRQIGDFEYHLRLIELGEFKKIPKILGYHRIHENSASYRKISFERANEYVQLMISILDKTTNKRLKELKNKILSQAYLISGRTHWRSNRYKLAIRYFIKSIYINPNVLLSGMTYRLLINALFNKKFYQLIQKGKTLSPTKEREK